MKDKANSRIAFFFLLCILTPGIITATSRMRIWGSGDVVNPKELSANLLYLEDLILSRDGGGGASIPIADKDTPGILNLGTQGITMGEKIFYSDNDFVGTIPVEDFYTSVRYYPISMQNLSSGLSGVSFDFCTDPDGGDCQVNVKKGYLLEWINFDAGYPLDPYAVQSFGNVFVGHSGYGDNQSNMEVSMNVNWINDAGDSFQVSNYVSDHFHASYDAILSDGGDINSEIQIAENISINASQVRIFNASIEGVSTMADTTYMNNLKLQRKIVNKFDGSTISIFDGGSNYTDPQIIGTPTFNNINMFGNYLLEYDVIIQTDVDDFSPYFAVGCSDDESYPLSSDVLNWGDNVLPGFDECIWSHDLQIYNFRCFTQITLEMPVTDGGLVACFIVYNDQNASNGTMYNFKKQLIKLTPQ